ncbi:MAG: retroviral-like aspartic protease family protein [Candidatus Obscuribacterales bacterium]|nr:retroviral-like aspartic protease family protein [Candidatus Obscuribacterales bacterium]
MSTPRPSKTAPLTRVLTIVTAMLVLFPPSAGADQYFDYGMTMLKKKDFAAAIRYFDQRLGISPNDSMALYYKAIAYHHSHDVKTAASLYQDIVIRFPGSEAAKLAQQNLIKLDDVKQVKTPDTVRPDALMFKREHKFTREDMDEDTEAKPDIIPDSSKVYFKRSGHDDIIVNGAINGRPIEMKFDTGAAGVFLGRNQLEALGLRIPEKARSTISGGIGGLVAAHVVYLEIKVGGIKKRVRCTVADEWDHYPLLGQPFFENLEYEFDNKGSCIYFRKPTERNVAKDPFSVPFRRIGNHLVVDVEMPGGLKSGMIVDTGAAMTMLTANNIRQLQIEVPADGQRMIMSGVGGMQEAISFPVDELRLGPIVQRGHMVSVLTSANSGMLNHPHGLLGQPFFSDWRYTIDNKNGVLRFFH